MPLMLLLCAALLACAGAAPPACDPRPDTVVACGKGALPPDAGPSSSGPPGPGAVPAGTVTLAGGSVERLWFATTGDTRPPGCDETDLYPRAAIAQIAASMKVLQVQFAVDLGDHMYVCNGSDEEAAQQMGFYMSAIAQGPGTWFLAMGNHECGNASWPYSCFAGGAHDANFNAFMAALRRPQPYYSVDVQTGQGLSRLVVVADDAWNAEQAAWLSATLSDADARARYTLVARHHPVQGTRTGAKEIVALLQQHKLSLVLTAHNHDYEHDTASFGGRSAVVGLGGAGRSWGFATILQNGDGSLTFVQRDASGNPVSAPWSVPPQ